MTSDQERFVRLVEEYYRDEYPAVMLTEVAKKLPSNREALSDLYQIILRSVEAKYRRVPDVAAITSAIRELYDAYPEHRHGERYTPPKNQLEASTQTVGDYGGIPTDGNGFLRISGCEYLSWLTTNLGAEKKVAGVVKRISEWAIQDPIIVAKIYRMENVEG